MCTYTDKPNIEIRNHRTDSRPTPPKRHYPTTEMTTKDRETVRTTDRPTDTFTRYDLTTERRTETKNHTMLNIGDARESECIHIMPIFYVCWCWIAHVCVCLCVCLCEVANVCDSLTEGYRERCDCRYTFNPPRIGRQEQHNNISHSRVINQQQYKAISYIQTYRRTHTHTNIYKYLKL